MGITPEDGVTLPVYIEQHGSNDLRQGKEPVAVLTPRPRDKRDLNFRPNIDAYLAGSFHRRGPIPNMQHGNFWKAQKADVTVFESQKDFFPFQGKHARLRDVPEGMQGEKVHIVCDGRNAVVTKAD